MASDYSVHVLFVGYCHIDASTNKMKANCSCTLIKGPKNIIVDTMTPWDADKILSMLESHHLKPDDIDYVVCTHGHSDHIGNNNLFLRATHIVGTLVNKEDEFDMDAFENGAPYKIDDKVEIIPTPGHTLADVSVIVRNDKGVYAIAGDLFENNEDVAQPEVWMNAGSESPQKQRQNRHKIAMMADWIVPGHGEMFECNDTVKKRLTEQIA